MVFCLKKKKKKKTPTPSKKVMVFKKTDTFFKVMFFKPTPFILLKGVSLDKPILISVSLA
jgi:hypothetical protein